MPAGVLWPVSILGHPWPHITLAIGLLITLTLTLTQLVNQQVPLLRLLARLQLFIVSLNPIPPSGAPISLGLSIHTFPYRFYWGFSPFDLLLVQAQEVEFSVPAVKRKWTAVGKYVERPKQPMNTSRNSLHFLLIAIEILPLPIRQVRQYVHSQISISHDKSSLVNSLPIIFNHFR